MNSGGQTLPFRFSCVFRHQRVPNRSPRSETKTSLRVEVEQDGDGAQEQPFQFRGRGHTTWKSHIGSEDPEQIKYVKHKSTPRRPDVELAGSIPRTLTSTRFVQYRDATLNRSHTAPYRATVCM